MPVTNKQQILWGKKKKPASQNKQHFKKKSIGLRAKSVNQEEGAFKYFTDRCLSYGRQGEINTLS